MSDPSKTIGARVRRRIVPNWKSRLHDWSTWALGLVAVLSSSVLAAWALMPAEWKAAIPPDAVLWIGGSYLALGAFGGVSKFIIQGVPKGEK